MNFLSQTNLCIHKEYLRRLKLRFSIFEKSYPELVGKKASEILKLPLQKSERDSAFRLKCEILAHEVYFSSFENSQVASAVVKQQFGSEAELLYRLYEEGIDSDGFLLLYIGQRGRIEYYAGGDYFFVIEKCVPLLAVDLCEHAYFYDFLFDKRKYLQLALSNFALFRLANINKGIEKYQNW